MSVHVGDSKIQLAQIEVLRHFSTDSSIIYSHLFKHIRKRTHLASSYLVSRQMAYKRIFELKKKGLVQSRLKPVFPAIADLGLTERGKILVKAYTFLQIVQSSLDPDMKSFSKPETRKQKELRDAADKPDQKRITDFFTTHG